VDSNGDVYLVGYTGTYVIRYKKYTTSGDSWGSLTDVYTYDSNHSILGVQCAAKGTDIYIVYSTKGIIGTASKVYDINLIKLVGGSTVIAPILIFPNPVGEGAFDGVMLYETATGLYYDRTAEAAGRGDVGDIIMPTTGKTISFNGDILYVGFASLASTGRSTLVSYLASTSEGGGTKVWEYWNGSTWTSLSTSSSNAPFTSTAGNIGVGSSGDNGYPTNWATSSIGGKTLYWMRLRLSASYSTAPVVDALTAQPPYYIPHTVTLLDSGDTEVPFIFVTDTFVGQGSKFPIYFSSFDVKTTVFSTTAGQIDLRTLTWGEWSDTCTVTPSVSTTDYSVTAGLLVLEAIKFSVTAGIINVEALRRATAAGKIDLEGLGKGTSAGQIFLEALKRATTAGQIITEGVPKATTSGLINLEAVRKNTTSGLIDLIGVGKSTTAGQIVLEGVPKSTTAGLINLEVSPKFSVTAGQVFTEAVGRNTTAGQIDMQKTTSQSAGLIDLIYADFRSMTAGQIFLEALRRDTSAGYLDLEKPAKSVTAGLINIEAHKLSTTAGRLDLQATTTSRTAGLINIEAVKKNNSAGYIFLESTKTSRTAGQIDLITQNRSTTAGQIVLQSTSRSTSAGMIDVLERVSGHLQAKVDKIPVIGYAEHRPSSAKVTPTSPTGNVSPSKPSASVLTQKPKGYR
jgi:hypothetical protein